MCNYLLLGSDSRAGLSDEEQTEFGTDKQIGGENRADTIMLVHTDPKLEKAIIISFPRDMYVPIPGHGEDKINAAFEGGIEGGGPELVAGTVQNLTGLKIDHFLYVDLAGFQGVIDELGGVDMCITGENVNTPGYVESETADGTISEVYYKEPGHIVDPRTGLDVKPGCQRLAVGSGAGLRPDPPPQMRLGRAGLLSDPTTAAVPASGHQSPAPAAAAGAAAVHDQADPVEPPARQ